ncbi:ParB/RepB/Spo0J family partition protein [Bradyrhizobium prioriisuperbiae]|uniref:ParB/RepB/Spo0J family partition protein n=1 Tax=Bradyrhizobium prioriisuperbiae TaxID=2854389 RepID=UPI0028E5B0C3|nr:ParB N-terminal domain-containing protein [Bradyrhizobium prioritasuperba]
MKLRELATSKRDMLMIDPRIILVEDGYNIRDLTTADAKAKLHDLARSIADNGFSIEQPITVRMKDEKVFVVAGHRRRAATIIAIEQLGAEIDAIPCIAEAKGTSEADRCADLVVSNSGEPLTSLEMGGVIKRLIGFGWDIGKIAKRFGWSSTQTVDGYLTLLSAPQAVQQMVRNDEVSSSTAISVVKKHGDAAEQTLVEAKARAAAAGKTKVTNAHVRATTGEFQPTAGNVKVLIAALQKIAEDSHEDFAGTIATEALESVGILKGRKVAA